MKSKTIPYYHPDPNQPERKNAIKVKKPIPELLQLATIVFNRWIKKRDRKDALGAVCISCGEYKLNAYIQAGHYMPSTYSALRFNEFNVHSECITCNCSDENHLVGYRKNLINKIGLDMVLWLEEQPLAANHKWDRDDLLYITTKYI